MAQGTAQRQHDRTVGELPYPAENFEAGREMTHALMANATGSDNIVLARAFGYRLISAWWSRLTGAEAYPALLRPPIQPIERTTLPKWVEELADNLGQIASKLDAESAAFQIGLTYSGMLPREHRASLGIYYTPPALTARLIGQATRVGVNWDSCRVLDPACGGGAFLAPVARRILNALPRCNPHMLIENIGSRLRGYEIDPFAAWMSQVALDAVMLPVTRETGQRLPVVVTICDSLRQTPSGERFDLVIGNPPYGRVRLAPSERKNFQRSLYGHANLYGLFTDLALRYAKSGGIIAYVTPTSFLAGQYFKKLRALLGHCAPPATIDFIAARRGVFDDVLQETLLATYRRDAAPGLISVHEIVPANGTGLVAENAGAFPLPADPSRPWILPRTAAQVQLVSRLAVMRQRLADWGYSVSTGPLVWNRHKDQLVERPGQNRLPLIWAEAVTSCGRFVFRAEKRNHLPYFEMRPGNDWLVTRSPCVLLQRTTAKEQHRRLIAAALPSGFLDQYGAVVIENHLNMLRPNTEHPLVPVEVLTTFLNSAAADRAFRCVSGSVAVSAYELQDLPLPAVEELDELTRLVSSNSCKAQVEKECMRLYRGKF